MNKRQLSRKSKRTRPPMTLADIYCGAGGLSSGFARAKAFWPGNKGETFKVLFGVDHNLDAIKSFRNYHFANQNEATKELMAPCQDVTKVTKESILKAIKPRRKLDILIGGPSCQGVSTAGLRNPNDHRNDMLRAFIRLVRELQPRWFVMENVPGLTHKNNRQLLRDIFKSLESIKGYKVAGEVLLAADYDVPQLRYRLFIIGTNTGAPIRFPKVIHSQGRHDTNDSPYITVRDAIYDLSKQKPNQYDARTLPNETDDRTLRIPNHYCGNTSRLNQQRIKTIGVGEDWRAMPIKFLAERYFATRASDQKGCYGRLAWDWPAYTITNACSNVTAGPFTHPDFDRALSVREAARLQSFTDEHVFFGSVGSQYDQVGNAVPPLLAKAVAEGILVSHYQRLRARKWGKEGRLTYKMIDASLKGKVPFPKLTERHVHPLLDRRKSKLIHNSSGPTSQQTDCSIWELRNRPKDPSPDETLRLRKLAKEPNNYRATKRARAIVQFLDGKRKKTILKEANASEQSVRKWINGYFARGLDGWRAYHKPVEQLPVGNLRLSNQLKRAISRVRRTLLSQSISGEGKTRKSVRLHMNSYLKKLIRRFGKYSVTELIHNVERKLNIHLGTVYVGDLLAIADVVSKARGLLSRKKVSNQRLEEQSKRLDLRSARGRDINPLRSIKSAKSNGQGLSVLAA